MRRKNVKTLVMYYREISAMVRLLAEEKAALEDQYDGLSAMNMDGMPHGTNPGKPVESMAVNLVDKHIAEKIDIVSVKIQVLEADAEAIKTCIDSLNGKYKLLIFYRYLDGYTWGHISLKMQAPDSTCRNWHEKALDRLGESMDEIPMVDELLDRALRART